MKLHPLMLPPVLEVLFKYCDLETLKRARLVCREWETHTYSAFNIASCINFYNMYPETYMELIKSIQNGCIYMPVNVALTLSPQLADQKCQERSLSVCPWHTYIEYLLPFGKSIEWLKFYAWESTTDKLNSMLFKDILLTPTFLRSLEISLLPKTVSTEPLFQRPWKSRSPLFFLTTLVMYGKLECSGEFLNNLLSAMPNVKEVTVNCCSNEFLDLFTAALHQIPLVRMEHLRLNFVGAFTESHILNIEKARFGLKTLHTAPRSLLTEFEEYYKLLSQVAPTLEDATLTSCTNLSNSEQYIVLPYMPKLKTLNLQSWRAGPAFSIWNLAFVNHAPNLETLVIERRGFFSPNWNSFDEFQCFIVVEDVQPHIKMSNLVLPSVPLQFYGLESLTSLLLKFSLLKDLTFTAEDKTLECICMYALTLEGLKITDYSKVTDKGITGMINVELWTENNEIETFNLSVGLTNLKRLKRLEIDGFAGRITDFSIEHGLMHLEKLESLTLRSCMVTNQGILKMSTVKLAVLEHDNWHAYDQETLDEFNQE